MTAMRPRQPNVCRVDSCQLGSAGLGLLTPVNFAQSRKGTSALFREALR